MKNPAFQFKFQNGQVQIYPNGELRLETPHKCGPVTPSFETDSLLR